MPVPAASHRDGPGAQAHWQARSGLSAIMIGELSSCAGVSAIGARSHTGDSHTSARSPSGCDTEGPPFKLQRLSFAAAASEASELQNNRREHSAITVGPEFP